MDSNFSNRPKKDESFQLQSGGRSLLILHNDDVNTFEYIMKSLMEVCRHSETQAEQCTLIAHYKGKCEILSGTVNELNEVASELTSRGIKTSIEKILQG